MMSRVTCAAILYQAPNGQKEDVKTAVQITVLKLDQGTRTGTGCYPSRLDFFPIAIGITFFSSRKRK
jgi:hypothetical protein